MIQLMDSVSCDGEVMHEVLNVLMCMVVAVNKAAVEATHTLLVIYSRESNVCPIIHVLHAVNEFNLKKSVTQDKTTLKNELKVDKKALIASQHIYYRLLHSTSRMEIQCRLQKQLETLRLAQNYALISVLPPTHLQITTLREDALDFRRNANGVAQVWGRNVLGENYAPKIDPLRYHRTFAASDIFKRMKRVVREDLASRNRRRIVALNDSKIGQNLENIA
ncbi:hypothetical protein Plhal703r1_c07g0041621 [Plasmopara halstedii]